MLRTESYTWGPYLWKTTLAEDIIEVILNRAIKSKGQDNASPMLPFNFDECWYLNSEDVKWFSGILAPHLKKYLAGYSRHNELPLSTDDDLKRWTFDSVWANWFTANDMTGLHNHVGDLSFVLYLQIPEYKDKVIGSAPPPGSISFTWGTDKKTFSPKLGELFIFPSGLLHTVMPYKEAESERISLSGNLYYDTTFHG
jgi:hypothetical protein|tara:strand:- start:369 stop:962 length:594 start_codon:yes stop_codon:yes gene_type:complete